MALCPGCEAEIEMDEFDVDKGEIISCPECGIDLDKFHDVQPGDLLEAFIKGKVKAG